jgi:nitrite reductase/ring-hydroxylating ferredoxin subunit/uncharacterized membrane protein
MLSHAINRFIDSQRWLDPLADALQKVTTSVYRGRLGRALKSLFNGTWLGHPLHPVLTDIPLGAWTLAIIFDLIYLFSPRSPMARSAAEIVIVVGIVAALGAAVTGYTDWGDTFDRERRLGLSHGLLNLVATLLYAVSLVLRLTSPGQGLGIGLSWIGYALLITAAYLGGDLVFNIGTGVNHHAFQEPPTDWTPAMRVADLAEGKPEMAECNGTPIFILKRGEVIRAVSDACSHAGGPLHEGTVENDVVVCPWHASRFDVRTGAVRGGPATVPLVRYDVRIQDGRVEVRRSPATMQPN